MKNKNLHNIKSSGFKTPDNYFKSFDDKLLSKLKGEDTLNTIKSSGFKVPDDYFESFEDNLLSQIDDKKYAKVISLFSWKKAAYISGIAASLVIMYNVLFNAPKNITYESLKTASVEDFIINEGISTYEIASLLEDTDLEEVSYIESSFNDNTIEDFIFDEINTIDIENLYTE